LKQLRAAAKALLDQLERGHASLRMEIGEASEIAKRLDIPAPAPGPAPGQVAGAVAATDLAKGFRSVIQTIQREIGEGDTGDVGTIIKSMDVELKGLIVVEDQQPKVVPPSPDTPVDPGTLSTIRMSFASVPIGRTADRDTGPR
jgi:hypothetical protein